MNWRVLLDDDFAREIAAYDRSVLLEIDVGIGLLRRLGPQLGRPHVDTLKGSRHANLKELRFRAADGAWRVVFAFDPDRAAILLVAGDKSGVSEKLFYKRLIALAEKRLDRHLRER